MKHCTQCGESNLDHASFCSKCGASLPIGESFQNAQEQRVETAAGYSNSQYPPHSPQKPPMPPTYLWQAIVVTIVCCLPLGIPAIVNASQVENRYFQGNYEGAMRSSRNAKNFSLWALIIGIIVQLGYVLLVIFGVVGGAFLDSLNGYY